MPQQTRPCQQCGPASEVRRQRAYALAARHGGRATYTRPRPSVRSPAVLLAQTLVVVPRHPWPVAALASAGSALVRAPTLAQRLRRYGVPWLLGANKPSTRDGRHWCQVKWKKSCYSQLHATLFPCGSSLKNHVGHKQFEMDKAAIKNLQL